MIVALDEIPRAADPCDPSLDWRPVRDHLGISAFGVNAFLGAQPGDRVVELHDEDGDPGQEELYVVVRGAARFVIDGDEHDVPAGSVVLVAPASTREAFATEPGTAVLVVGAAPGVPFAVSAWEQRQLARGYSRALSAAVRAQSGMRPSPLNSAAASANEVSAGGTMTSEVSSSSSPRCSPLVRMACSSSSNAE